MRELRERASFPLATRPPLLLLVLPGDGWEPSPPGCVRRATHTSSSVLAELERAVAVATEEVRLVAVVARAAGSGAPGVWRAAAWMLERRHPERWGSPRATRRVLPPIDAEGDPFVEVDQIAEARRRHDRNPTGY